MVPEGDGDLGDPLMLRESIDDRERRDLGPGLERSECGVVDEDAHPERSDAGHVSDHRERSLRGCRLPLECVDQLWVPQCQPPSVGIGEHRLIHVESGDGRAEDIDPGIEEIDEPAFTAAQGEVGQTGVKTDSFGHVDETTDRAERDRGHENCSASCVRNRRRLLMGFADALGE